MDAFRESVGGLFEPDPALDSRAPVAARALLMLSLLDAQIERLQLDQMSLVRRIEQVRREARAAHEELRAQEMQLMFVESSSPHTTPAEAVRRMQD
jgi:hypothetical protein